MRLSGPLAGACVVACLVACNEASPPPTDDTVQAPPAQPAPRRPKVAAPPDDEALGFRDITGWAGLAAVVPGQGGAWFDLDGDIDDDIVLPTSRGLATYLNDGTGWFTSGPEFPHASPYGGFVYAVDLSGDGHGELLYLRRGVKPFERPPPGVSEPFEQVFWAGDGALAPWPDVLPGLADGRFGSTGTFGDFDGDGRTELLIATLGLTVGSARNDLPKKDTPGAPDALWRRAGDVFLDDRALESFATRSFAVTAADLDDDGRPELLVGTDEAVDHVIRWSDGVAVDVGASFGLANSTAAMGWCLGDVDGDLDLDIFLTDNDSVVGHKLYLREGATYRVATAEAGLSSTTAVTGWGCGLHDLDLDGDLDVMVVNGDACLDCVGGEQATLLFLNDGRGHFSPWAAAAESDLALHTKSRAALFSDADRDGDLDVLVVNVQAEPRLLRNDLGRGHWLAVALREPGRWPSVGAVVTLTAGGLTQRRWVVASASYGGSETEWIHFGLGAAAAVDSLEIRWPDGVKQQVAVGTVDRRLVIRRDDGQPAGWPPAPDPSCAEVCAHAISCVSPSPPPASGAAGCGDLCVEEERDSFARRCLASAPCDRMWQCMY